MAAIACLSSASGAAAYQVVYTQGGRTTDSLMVSYASLGGPGTYKFVAITSQPVNFYFEAGYKYHTDDFIAPAPRPHHENIRGHDSPYSTGASLDGKGQSWTFIVPETTYSYFTADSWYEQAYGVPAGTLLYSETKWENPWFSLFYFPQTSEPVTYRFSVLRMTAVPEPATWAMMIIGFGVTGSMLRNTRRRAALALS